MKERERVATRSEVARPIFQIGKFRTSLGVFVSRHVRFGLDDAKFTRYLVHEGFTNDFINSLTVNLEDRADESFIRHGGSDLQGSFVHDPATINLFITLSSIDQINENRDIQDIAKYLNTTLHHEVGHAKAFVTGKEDELMAPVRNEFKGKRRKALAASLGLGTVAGVLLSLLTKQGSALVGTEAAVIAWGPALFRLAYLSDKLSHMRIRIIEDDADVYAEERMSDPRWNSIIAIAWRDEIKQLRSDSGA